MLTSRWRCLSYNENNSNRSHITHKWKKTFILKPSHIIIHIILAMSICLSSRSSASLRPVNCVCQELDMFQRATCCLSRRQHRNSEDVISCLSRVAALRMRQRLSVDRLLTAVVKSSVIPGCWELRWPSVELFSMATVCPSASSWCHAVTESRLLTDCLHRESNVQCSIPIKRMRVS